MRIPTVIATVIFLCAAHAAERGDKSDQPAVVQEPIVPREVIPPSPALSAAEEAKTFHAAAGYHVELVASEPLVGDSVAARAELGDHDRLGAGQRPAGWLFNPQPQRLPAKQ